jgi:elongation factor P
VARASHIKKGDLIRWHDDLWKVLGNEQVFSGKRGAYHQLKLQSVTDSHVEQNRFSSTDNLEEVSLEVRNMEYLYQDGSSYVFMDPQNGEQLHIAEGVVRDALPYLSYNTRIDIFFHEDKPVSIELPSTVVLEVVQTEPAMKGGTITAVTKPAELETGLVVKVPGHVKTGDKVQVDTRTGEFMGRA